MKNLIQLEGSGILALTKGEVPKKENITNVVKAMFLNYLLK